MTRSKHFISLAAALTLSVGSLLSFVAQANTEELDPITVVLDWTVNTNHTGLYVAQALGYYTDEHVSVSIESPPETGAATMLLSGAAQIAVSYQEEVTMARVANKPLTAIAAILQHNTSGFASRSSSQITSPKDFVGKRYGGWGSPIEEAMVRALVEQDGGDPQAVDILPIGNVDFFSATQNAVDFIWVFEGWDVVAAKLKEVEVNYIPLATVPALDYYTPLLAGHSDWLQAHSDTVKAFLRATTKGYQYAIDNPVESADILIQAAPELDKKLVLASQQFLATQYQAEASRWGEMALERWVQYADWLSEHDLLEGTFSAPEAFSNDYLP